MAQKLEEKTTEQLTSELNGAKKGTSILIGILIVLYAVLIYSFFTREDNSTEYALLAVAISCSAFIPIQLNAMKKVKEELKSRGVEV